MTQCIKEQFGGLGILVKKDAIPGFIEFEMTDQIPEKLGDILTAQPP